MRGRTEAIDRTSEGSSYRHRYHEAEEWSLHVFNVVLNTNRYSQLRWKIIDFDASEPEILKSRRSEAGNLEIRKLQSRKY